MKTFFIVGAQFDNKGAQSMLFVTVDELRKRYPDCKIYCACTEWIDNKIYKFDCIYYSDREKNIVLGINKGKNYVEAILKDTVKVILGRYNNLFKYHRLEEILKETDFMIDISGYNIGDKWDLATHESYFNNIRLAIKFNIPIVLMPQSFGPFHYTKNKDYLMSQICELFKYPVAIYAREMEGYQLLKKLGLDNIELSSDLVLQNKGICKENVLKYDLKNAIPEIEANDNVGIIPNSQCFAHGNRDDLIALYKTIMNELLKRGKNVYIFRHSREDLQACKMLYELAEGNKNVHLIKNDFSCLEYDEWIKKFDFIIASRFHAIVHAYRNYVPCILLGWAIKYNELASKLGQEKNAFDITSEKFNADEVVKSLNVLISEYGDESEIIKLRLKDIQDSSCFDNLFGKEIIK